MSLKSLLAAGGLAGAALVLSASAALAAPGMATANVHVRSGPSVGYRVIDSLYDGERVDIGRCRGGWCYVTHRGPDGWVSANYLARERRPVYRRPAPPPIIIRPPVFYPPHHWGRRPFPPPHHGHMGPSRHDRRDLCRRHPDWRICRDHGHDHSRDHYGRH